MVHRALLLLVLLVGCGAAAPPSAPAPSAPPPRATNAHTAWPAGTTRRFTARWTDGGEPWVYDALITLHYDGRAVVGEIAWTLVVADPAYPDLVARQGSSAVESVVGSYFPGEGRLDLSGRSVSDSSLIGTDSYQLVLGRDGSLVGRTRSDESDWNGAISGRALE